MALVENNATGHKRCIRIRRGHKRAQEALASVAAAVSQNIPVGTRAGILIGDEHCAGGENQATWPIHLPLPETTKIAKCLDSFRGFTSALGYAILGHGFGGWACSFREYT